MVSGDLCGVHEIKTLAGGPDGISKIPFITLFGFSPDGSIWHWFYIIMGSSSITCFG
jgi:hypothetical protein